VDFPALSRGEGKVKLISVALQRPTEYFDYPYGIKIVVEFIGRSLPPHYDQVFSWIEEIFLECTVNGAGEFLVVPAKPFIVGGVGGYKTWINPPWITYPYTLDDVDLIRTMASLSTSKKRSSFAISPPYLSSLLDYWEREKIALYQCQIDPDKIRDCTLEAMEDTAFTETLTLENFKDLVEIMKTFKSSMTVVKDFRLALRNLDPKRLLNVVASVHLIWRYVIKTSYRDLIDLRHFAKQIWVHRDIWWGYLTKSRGRSRELNYLKVVKNGKTYDSVMNLRLDLSPAQYQLFTYLRTVGMSPSLVGFWDVLPFSFVVDWVLPVGATISAYGALQDLQFLEKLFVYSLKSTRPVNDVIYPGVLLAGEAQRFSRVVTNQYQGSQGLPAFQCTNPLRNFWTGLALLIASITRR
jgi:hypothetical protein